jgi:ABC-type Mn2+/Zn2+ transport system ATPase subunit
MNKVIEFKSVKLGYNRRIVFDSLDLKIYEGDFLGIVGPNGSGKTTLLRSIMGLLKPRGGEIIRDRNLRFGYCMQRQFIDTLFPFTVFEIVMMARTKFVGPLRGPRSIDRDKVLKALEITGIRNLANEPFYDLSGGQKQRVLLARALSTEPNFLIFDEPTTDLDIKAEREILSLIKDLQKGENLTVALVTHELNEAINIAQKFIFLNKSIPCKIFARDELSGSLLSEIFDTQITLKEIDGQRMVC